MKFSVRKTIAAALSLLSISSLSFGAACAVKSTQVVAPENSTITKIDAPTDGSLPTAHSGTENLAYIAQVFGKQQQYHVYSYTLTNASITTQITRGFRDYKDGVLISSDITYSSVVKSGTQTCTVFNEEKGEYEVYARSSETPSTTTTATNAVWSEEAPTYYTQNAYNYTYGLLQNELTNFIINEESVLESGEVHENPDGTYTQSFVLDPVISTYYYSYGMKTRGGLNDYPDFQNVTLSVTFTDKWLPLSVAMHDVSTINKGVIVNSISDTTCEISYDEFDNTHFGYYDGYFKQYLGNDDLEQGGDIEEEFVLDVTNVLSNGFSKIMDGGAQFEIDLDLGVNKYRGFVFVALDIADPLETLEIRLSLGKTLKEQGFYIEYKNGKASAYYGADFALDVNIATLKPVVGEIVGWAEQLAKSFEKASAVLKGDGEAEEDGDMLAELLKVMTLEVNGGEATLKLKSDDLLGLGVGVDVQLYFGVEAKSVTFRGGVVNGISVGGSAIDLNLVLRSTTAEVISREKTEASANLTDYVADAFSLLSSDLIKINAKIDGNAEGINVSALKGLSAEATAYVDIDGVTLGAEATVSYAVGGGKLSAVMDVWYDYDVLSAGYGKAVLTLKEINGAPVFVQVGCDIAQLADAIGTVLIYGGAENGVSLDGVVQMINAAFSRNFSSLLTEVYADNLQIRLGVNVDTVLSMLGVKAGVKFGSCTLAYTCGEGVYGGELSAALPAIGFGIAVSGAAGEIEQPDTANCLDLAYLIEDITSLAKADLYEVNIDFDGDKIERVKGLKANVTAYADVKGLAAYAKVNVSYTYNELPVSAQLRAWYDYDKDTNGTVVLSLESLNGVETNVRVKAEINKSVEAVKELLAYCNVQLEIPEFAVNVQLEEVLSNVLTADFATLIPELATTADGLKLGVNADEVLKLFNANISVTLGTVNLAYSHSNCNLSASVPALGLGVTVYGLQGEIERAPEDNVLDLAELVELINSAAEQINGIIKGEAVSFEILRGQTYLYLDGLTVNLWGNGEVSWKHGGEYVALDLGMSIAESGLDVTTFKLLYRKNEEGKPLVRLALNEVGIDIYPEDVLTVTEGFAGIYEKISFVFGGGNTSQMSAKATNGNRDGSGALDFSTLTSNDKIMTLLFKALSSGSWVDVLNDMTLTVDKQVVTADGVETVKRSLILTYASDNAAEVRVSANGNIALYYDVKVGGGFSFGGEVEAKTAAGVLVKSLDLQFDNMNTSSSKEEGSASFIKLAYDYLFEAISSVSVKDILGSDTYSVTFGLIGDNCNIAALKGVNVNAEVYVTGKSNDNGKIAEADLNIDVAGVNVSLNVITERVSGQTYFYVNLKQVANFALPDLKFMATQDSLFDTIAVLIKTINDTNVLELLGGLIQNGKTPEEVQTTVSAESGSEITEDKVSKIAGVIEKLMNFNFGEAVVASNVGGVTTAVLDLDNALRQLGVKSEPLGTVEIEINHDYHAMKTSGKALVADAYGVMQLKEWISLVSQKTAARDYSKLNKDDYISIEFLSDLIGDLVNFATDANGKIYESFTFSGSISAKIVGLFTVNIDNCAVTVSMKESGLYVSVVAHVNRVSALGLVTIPESTFGLTYQNGLLTLARGLNTSSPEYKIMTFDYFIDHMLTESNSAMQWLLDISGWKTLLSIVKSSVGELNVNSGLTTPENVYLYSGNTAIKDDKEISMSDFVNAISVIVNGNRTAHFGDPSALEKALGVYDNYYGFALNAQAISGGVLTELYAAVTRNAEGINAIKAYGAIQSYVTFSINLNYEEGCNNEYIIGKALSNGVSAPSLYGVAKAIADNANQKIDTEYFAKKPESGYDEKFGCFSISSDGKGYAFSTEYSNVLYSHVLTVVGPDGEIERRDVRHGSTVYLYDNNSPVYTDGGNANRLLYSTSQTEPVGNQVIMNGDMTVYALKVKAVKVIIHNGNEEIVVNSFVGDKVPTRVEGLQSLKTPVYANGTEVGENDKVPDGLTSLDIYGVFVNTEAVVNYVKYTFSSQTMSYTASGKAAGFNDYYSVKGNTLVLENEIGGYPVTAIADGAFANTEGKPIVSVIVPENVTYIGKEAFRDNVDMKRAAFLAESVYFSGSDSDGTFAFYGCNTSENKERTRLVVYYNAVTCDSNDMLWTHFYTASSVGIKYYKYIGNDPNTSELINYHENGGGALVSGDWYKVDFTAEVNLNGVTGSTLTKKSVEQILEPYFPLIIAGRFTGSAEEASIQKELEAACTQFDINRNGITFKCVFTTSFEQFGRNIVVKYSVTYTAACTVNVYSSVEFTYYGVQVKANTLTAINIPVEGESVNMAAPELDTHDFTGWTFEEKDGVEVYNAGWKAKEFNLKIRLTRGGTDTNIVHINGETKLIKGGVVKGTVDVKDIVIYGGEAAFTLTDNVLTIVTGDVTYTVYVTEASITGKDKNNKRNLKSDLNGTLKITQDMTLTLSY